MQGCNRRLRVYGQQHTGCPSAPICRRSSRQHHAWVVCQSAPNAKSESARTQAAEATRVSSHAATTMPQTAAPPDVECVVSGLDGVQCYVVDPVTHEGHKAKPQELQQLEELAHPPAQAEQAPSLLQDALSIALLVSPFAFWGTSMVAMKGLMTSVPPMLMGAFRLLPAGFVLVGWAAAQGRPQPSTPVAWAWVAAFALVDGAAFQGFLAEGLQRTSAGLGSVIIDSQPLTVAALAALLFGESLGWTGVLGLLTGVAGLLLLELPEQYLLLAADGLLQQLPGGAGMLAEASAQAGSTAATAAEATGAASAAATAVQPVLAASADAVSAASGSVQQWGNDMWALLSMGDLAALSAPSALMASGEAWMLLAAQSMAVGTVMSRYVMQHADPVMATGWHMVLGGLLLAGVALHDDPQAISHAVQNLQPQDLAAAAYVSLLGGAASYGIFFWQASTQGNLTKLSSLTFLTPVFAAVCGYFVLGEVLTAPQMLGGAVTLSSVFLINGAQNSGADSGSGDVSKASNSNQAGGPDA